MTSPITNAEARALSVEGKSTLGIPLTMRSISRGALLSPVGTQARERELRNLYRNPHNTLASSTIAGITSKIVSSPYEVTGPTDNDSENAQAMLINACIGKGAEHLFSVTSLNYLRHDRGVWWELIGYGDPDGPLVGYPVAVNVLDSLRCFPTGDDEHPVWYYSRDGKIHKLHATRVVHFVDMPDGDDEHPDVGMCALSRAVAVCEREILAGRYISTRLDDKPKPGIMLFKNIEESQYENAQARYIAKRRAGYSDEDVFGEVFMLFGVDPHEQTGVEVVSYSEAPEKFDFIAYVNLDAKELALAFGVDIQEIWELSGGNIGTSTQSQILHEKSKGKTIGRLRKMFERALNLRVLPPECEFRWQYRDSQEDKERADLASTWATTAITIGDDLSQLERRQLLANQVEAVGDVLLDAQGQVRLPDDDIDPAAPTITEDDENTEDEQEEPALRLLARKAFSDTASEFADSFVTLVDGARSGALDRRRLGIRLRDIYSALKDILNNAHLDTADTLTASTTKRRQQALASHGEAAFIIRKGRDGLRYIGLITSNAYVDRDREIVSHKALQEWVNHDAWKGGEYVTGNPLLFWHAGLPIGDVIWSDMRGPFLIEVAKERRNPFAKMVIDLVERLPIAWGVSQGFRDKGHTFNGRWKVYHRIAKKETSILPLVFAANAFTQVEVTKMANKLRLNFLRKHAPEAAELERRLSRSAQKKQAQLDRAGVTRKQRQTGNRTTHKRNERGADPRKNRRQIPDEDEDDEDDLEDEDELDDEEKALDVETLADGLVAMIEELLAEAGADVPDDLLERVAALIEAASSDDAETMAADDEEEDDDEEPVKTRRSKARRQIQTSPTDRANTARTSVPGRTSAQALARKQTALLEALMDDLEILDELTDEVKALKPVAGLPKQFKALERRLSRVERKMSGGVRAASEDDDSEVDEDDDTDLQDKVRKNGKKTVAEGMFPDLYDETDE